MKRENKMNVVEPAKPASDHSEFLRKLITRTKDYQRAVRKSIKKFKLC